MDKNEFENIPFSPILIMEFIRQVTINRFLNESNSVQFKIAKNLYKELEAYPLKVQKNHLSYQYDSKNEILSVSADEIVLNRFREQKSLIEIAGKYEQQYAQRYKQFIEVIK